MKSKDIIKLLQKEDPTGETHVRFGRGELLGFERKPGYYDGAYTYKNEDGKFVITEKGEKIDAHFEDLDDIIWECHGDTNKIMQQIIVETRDANSFVRDIVEPEAKKARKFHKTSLAEFTYYVMGKVLKEGWEITQHLDTKIGHYNQMWFEKDDVRKRLRQGDCDAVLESGFFKHIKTEACYKWILK